MTNNNTLTGYCFLAALTENQNDLFHQVYVPICKRALSFFSLNNSSHGSAEDIKGIIIEQYGIDVPILMIRKLIKAVDSNLSKKAKREINFQIFSHGNNFQIEKYAFVDLEEKYKKVQRNAKALQCAFEEYIKKEGIDQSETSNFTDFLNKNKNRLSAFFATGKEINGVNFNKLFIYHVQFLEYIEINNHELYKIAENIFLGSIVAGFLEAGFEMEAKFVSNEIYYIDTPIVLRALDLQKEEETKPAMELLDLIKNTGGHINILSVTIDEISGILEKAIATYNNSTPTSTINEACLRKNMNKSSLILLNGKLEEELIKRFDLKTVQLTQAHKDKYSKSPDIKSLKDERFRKGTAEHDVWCYLFVREKRNGSVSSFQKAKEWFLTSNKSLLNFNIERAAKSYISEIILPDALTGLLWLKNPIQLAERVKSIGLSELMAITLDEEIASKELISEFDNSLKSIEGLSKEDYRILLESVAHQSAKNIERVNDVIIEDKQKAQIEIQKIVEKERTRRKQTQEKIKDAQLSEKSIKVQNEELISKLNEISATLEDTKTESSDSKTKIEILADEIKEQKKLVRKYVNRLVFGLISLAIFIIVIFFHERINTLWKFTGGFLSASGWIWGLGSFLINSYKLANGK